MKTKMISWSVMLAFLAAGTVSAYHIPDQEDTANPGFIARSWTTDATLGQLVVCESIGEFDPVNDAPVPHEGVNGICYAASQDLWDENGGPDGNGAWEVADVKDKKNDSADDQPAWSYLRPTCFFLDPITGMTQTCPPTDDKHNLPDWFARVGSNAHSCNGAWEQEFRYKELLAYYHGSQPDNVTGASGHVTFFVSLGGFVPELAPNGTYHSGKDADPPDPMKTNEEDPLGNSLCSGSNFVGLSDDSTKKDP